jgi:DinB superfamily
MEFEMGGQKIDEITELKTINEDAQRTFGKLSAEQINWKSNVKNWSIGQCFEHLIITNQLYFPAIQNVIDGKHRNNFYSEIPFSTNLIGALMKNALKPEQARKMKTFKIFEPSASNVSATIIEDFVDNNRKLVAMFEAVKGLEMNKIKIPEPLNVALNLRLNDAFEILVLHEKRHFNQAKRALETAAFPK